MYYIQVVDTGHIIGVDDWDKPQPWKEGDNDYHFPIGFLSESFASQAIENWKYQQLKQIGNHHLSYYNCRVVQLIPTFKVVGE